jgi:hydroxymethylbilane synthase
MTQTTSDGADSRGVELVIASRESRLALWQAEHVRARLLELDPALQVRIHAMTTRGDQILDRSLSKVGGKGLFVKELETAMQQGQADLAVHSLKDVPMQLPDGFELCAILEREDPRDAWVSTRAAHFTELPQGAVVGTSSLRREMQIRALRPDLQVRALRGNLDTRLRKLDEGQFDGIVLAAAGLLRLGLRDRIRAFIDTEQMLPAPGQAALGLEVRAGDGALAARLGALQHSPTALAALAERALARVLGGSCSTPLGAHARWGLGGGELQLRAVLGLPDASRVLRVQVHGAVSHADQADELGRLAAQRLREQGAQALLDQLRAA